MNAVLSSQSMPYGAPELRRAARPDMVRALLLSSLLVTTAFALALALSPFYPKMAERIIEMPLPSYHTESFRIPLPSPPPLAPSVKPAPAKRAVDAVPVVVEDPVVPAAPPTAGNRTGTDTTVPPDIAGRITIDDGTGDRPVNQEGEIAFVDRFPVSIRRVTPLYPDLARQAGVEGTVTVHLLVGQDGRIREVKVHPEKHVPMLDTAALEAARAWTFEPALANGRPVAVWVSVPFKFALHGR